MNDEFSNPGIYGREAENWSRTGLMGEISLRVLHDAGRYVFTFTAYLVVQVLEFSFFRFRKFAVVSIAVGLIGPLVLLWSTTYRIAEE